MLFVYEIDFITYLLFLKENNIIFRLVWLFKMRLLIPFLVAKHVPFQVVYQPPTECLVLLFGYKLVRFDFVMIY